ncbi:UDP-glucose/GDP-mannose dehydrogenase family protein [Clostridiaceae bacterium 35-E11]
MHKIGIIGSGYVGLVTGACLADFGMDVLCIDNNEKKINALQQGEIPIYEPRLGNLVKKNVSYQRLHFSTDIKTAVKQSEIIFIAVGTPPTEDGSADLQYIIQVAEDIGKYINGYKVIVTKSTVPVGTGQKIKKIISNILKERKENYTFDVVSNPEFLREGSAIDDFIHPDRIILGVESERARSMLENVYSFFYQQKIPFLITNIETAEMIKYASNAFLAMKITYINELATLCERVKADIIYVARAMGMDQRISPKFLNPGPGYGGSCFPKDTKALVRLGQEYGEPLTLIEQTISANEKQKYKMLEKIKYAMGNLVDKTLGILGITFKPDTDDMREAPSLVILEKLAKEKVKMKIYDPKGEKEGKWRFEHIQNNLQFCNNPYEAVQGTDGLVILTEWNEFRNLDLCQIKNIMKDNYFFDFRNIYERDEVEKEGFQYYCIGR